MTIDVVIVVVDLSLWGCLYPSFYIQRGVVTRKVPESVTSVVIIGLYL
jgi:hypothetical protein